MRISRYLALFTLSSLFFSATAQAQQGVCVYKDSHYEGPRRCFEDNIRSFSKLGMNDQISSFQIHGNVDIIFYEHSNFKGGNKRFSNGQSVLNDGLNDNFSSMKIVKSRNQSRWGDRGHWGNQGYNDGNNGWLSHDGSTSNQPGVDGHTDYPSNQPGTTGYDNDAGRVCLYEDENYRGKSFCFTHDDPRFDNIGFDNKADSMRIEGNIEVELFQHSGYKGFSQIYRQSTPRFSRQEHDQYSAIKIRSRNHNYNNNQPGYTGLTGQACLYPDRGYRGQPYCFTSDNARFADFGFDNQADSIKLQGNIEVILYQHENYTGYSKVFRNNVSNFRGKDHDQYSSIKIRRY